MIATSGALGILIPPSIVMVLVAVATGGSVAFDPEGKRVLSASVAQLFMAGVIPGIDLGDHARHDHLLPRLEERLSAHAEGELAGGYPRFPRFDSGACC